MAVGVLPWSAYLIAEPAGTYFPGFFLKGIGIPFYFFEGAHFPGPENTHLTTDGFFLIFRRRSRQP